MFWKEKDQLKIYIYIYVRNEMIKGSAIKLKLCIDSYAAGV